VTVAESASQADTRSVCIICTTQQQFTQTVVQVSWQLLSLFVTSHFCDEPHETPVWAGRQVHRCPRPMAVLYSSHLSELFGFICVIVIICIFIPAKAREYVFTGVGLCVCLSVTTITNKIVDGFAPNFMRRFLRGKGKTKFVFRYDR